MTKTKLHKILLRYLISTEALLAISLALIVAVVSWGMISFLETEAKTNLRKMLSASLKASQTGIVKYLNTEKRIVDFWANNERLQALTRGLLELPVDSQTLISNPLQQEVRSLLTPLLGETESHGYFILNKNNLNLASFHSENIGFTNLLVAQEDFLGRVWEGEILISLPQESDIPILGNTGQLVEKLPTMFVAAPIQAADGKIFAVLTLRLDPDEGFTSVFQQANYGKSGDSYAFNREGFLISESRFDEQLRQIGLLGEDEHSNLHIQLRDPGVNLILGQPPTPRNQQPLTHMAQRAIAEEKGENLEGYRDYRGVPVVGAWDWNHELGFGFATEIDVEEAFRSFYITRLVIVLFALLSVVMLIILSSFSYLNRIRMASNARELDFQKSALDEHAIVTITDSQGTLLYVNDKFCSVCGYSREELIGQNYGISEPSEESSEYVGELLKTMLAGDVWKGTVKNRTKNGEDYWIASTVVPFLDEEGNIFQAISISTDVTELHKLQVALRHSNETLEQRVREVSEEVQKLHHQNELILNAVGEGVYGLDMQGRTTFANPAAAKLVGWEIDELLGRSQHDLIHHTKADGEPYSRDECPIYATFKDGETRHIDDEVFWHKDGTSFPVEYISTPIFENGKPEGAVVTFRDISDRLVVEEQLRHAQKMDALGNLAGGVAHSLNNLLVPMISLSRMTLDDLPKGSDALESLKRINEAAERAKMIVSRILAFSRRQKPKLERTDLTKLLSDALNLVRSSMPPTIHFEYDLPDSPFLVEAEGSQIEAAILNIINNAIDTVGERSDARIEVGVEHCQLKLEQVRLLGLQEAGEYINIRISDNGTGMDPRVRERIFDPFFTTKELGRGTGLGLSMAHGVITHHHGAINVKSTPGEGTIFEVYLPGASHTPNTNEESVKSDAKN